MVGFNAMMLCGSKSAADATYVEDEVLMPKAVKRGEVPAIIGIEILHPNVVKTQTTTEEYSKWHLSTKSQDDVINFSDEDCIEMGSQQWWMGTEVGGELQGRVERVILPAPVPITSAKLYIGFKQNFGATFEYHYRLIMVPRYVPGIVQQNNLTTTAQF